MPPILRKTRDLFNRNPGFLAFLRSSWETSTQTDKNPLYSQHEAQAIIESIETLSKHYLHNNIDHLPQVIPHIRLSDIASPISRGNSEILALNCLRRIKRLLPVHIEVSKIIQKTITDLDEQEKLSNAKVHSITKENGDFEMIIMADHPDYGPYFLVGLLNESIETCIGNDCPEFKLRFIEEENEERAFIEVTDGHSKIIIRDLSSQCYRKDFNPLKPFNVRGESSSFRSKLLTIQLLSFMEEKLLLPQREKDFPQDIYPYIVRCFLRRTKTKTLLSLSDVQKGQQIKEEHCLWNEFLSFCRKPQNLFEILSEAQASLIGFGDYDCIQKDMSGNYLINEYSEYAGTCKRLMDVFRPASAPEGLEEEDAPESALFLQEPHL